MSDLPSLASCLSDKQYLIPVHPNRHNDAASRCQWRDCTFPGTFVRTGDLKRHVKTEHIDTQSHKYRGVPPSRDSPELPECNWKACTYNKRTFRRLPDLERHVYKTHIEPGMHQCPVVGCEKVYNRRDTLNNHYKRHHDSGGLAGNSPSV